MKQNTAKIKASPKRKLSRVLYLGYYLKQLDRELFKKFLDYASDTSGRSRMDLLKDALNSVFKYNISLMEYFQFRFYEKSENDRLQWAGTGYMYEYQLMMNPKDKRGILDDKTKFYKNYDEFFVHGVADRKDLKEKPGIVSGILANPSGKMVMKASDGKCGADVEIRKTNEFSSEQLISYMKEKNYGIVEEFITQHSEINRLSPSAVNTIRIFTELDKNAEPKILGCRLRISVNSPVDNMAAGNLAAPVDEATGIVNGSGVYSDITKPPADIHPVTGVNIVGFQIPMWQETMKMVKKAAKKHPQNRSIGWDVVITDRGPGLIEGNHDWCKLLWQLPVKTGLKSELQQF